MKKKALIALGIILVLAIGGFFVFRQFFGSSNNDDAISQKKRVELPTNVIAVEERPYMRILPLGDGHNLDLEVVDAKITADTVEYELEYQAGSLLQGAFGELDLASLPATTRVLLGSCSAGGACSFHEDVQGGTLLTRFDGKEPYALKSRWKYIDNAAGETAHSSQDAKFQIDGANLARQRYLVIFNTAGYPEGLKGQVVSEIYSLTSSGNLSGEAELSIRAEEEGELTIMGYDGNEWVEFETTSDGKQASATVELMELYLVIKS